MLSTLDGLPIAFAVTGAKANERDTLLSMLETTPVSTGQLLLADKGYNGKALETELKTGKRTIRSMQQKFQAP